MSSFLYKITKFRMKTERIPHALALGSTHLPKPISFDFMRNRLDDAWQVMHMNTMHGRSCIRAWQVMHMNTMHGRSCIRAWRSPTFLLSMPIHLSPSGLGFLGIFPVKLPGSFPPGILAQYVYPSGKSSAGQSAGTQHISVIM